MAISVVGTNTGTNTCSIPTHQAGDTIVYFAFRDGSTTAPSLPAGWWNYFTETGANTCSIRIIYKVATAAGTSAPTITNATSVICVVYRGAAWLGSRASSRGSSTSFSYPALTCFKSNSTSYIGAFVASRDGTNTTLPNVQNAPTGLTNVTSVKDATDAAGYHDSNGTANSFSSASVGTGVAATGWYTFVFEIVAYDSSFVGYDEIGASTNTFTDWFVGASFDCTVDQTINRIKWYGKANTTTITFDCSIYEETSQNNYTFIKQATATINVTTTPGWVEFTLTDTTFTVGKRYYLAVWSSGAFTFYFNQTGRQAQTYATTGNTFNTWPSPESGGATDTAPLSIYAYQYTAPASNQNNFFFAT